MRMTSGLLATGHLLLLVCGPAWGQNLVIANARIIDGNGGVMDSGSVVVQDGRIASVSAAPADAGGAQVIDADGLTVMPGFIDAHRHVISGDPDKWLAEQAVPRMQEFLDAGFTTVLSAGDDLDAILELRRRLGEGEIRGPRLIAAGRAPLAQSTGGFAPGVDPARIDISRPPHRPTEPAPGIPHEQTRARIQQLAEVGVDAIKTVIIITPDGPEQETLSVIADEAERLGIPSITHAVTVVDTVAAVEAGTHVLVHTPHIGQLDEETAQMIADSGIPMMSTLGIFVPTFAADNAIIRDRTGMDNVPRFRDLEPFPMDTISSAGQGPVNARMLWDAGIVYGFGTDTRFLPRDSLFHELRPLHLVFSAEDIVTIMSRNAAIAIGRLDELGTVEAGKLADLVLLDGDPLDDPYNLLKVSIVIKGGEIVVDNR
ncbi:MAG: amidohydrolase family protein [Rhodospirillaceae bacterium]|nr:amidohydrolase family protein [Rhodospirillaceae bacterium]MDE0360985.1 amidohydrolase family protein [Rhodospirillaceae bacterium]